MDSHNCFDGNNYRFLKNNVTEVMPHRSGKYGRESRLAIVVINLMMRQFCAL